MGHAKPPQMDCTDFLLLYLASHSAQVFFYRGGKEGLAGFLEINEP